MFSGYVKKATCNILNVTKRPTLSEFSPNRLFMVFALVQ